MSHGCVREGATGADVSLDGATDSPESLIRGYYEAFNDRRIDEAAGRFDEGARLEHVTGRAERGPDGYRHFAERWLDAFPDALLNVDAIRQTGPQMYDVDLVATGTHTGTLSFGAWVFRPTTLPFSLSARELFQIEHGRFQFAALTFDLQELVRQLAIVDVAKLSQHLARIQQLAEQLAASKGTPARQRELIDRLGGELDEARRAVRPYFR